MSDVLDLFIAEARAVPFESACDRVGVPQPLRGKPEHQGPCPRCGGNDRFAVNRKKGVWNCRGCGAGGRDGIGLAAHVKHLDVSRRADFLETCSIILNQPVPSEGERESDEDRAARLLRIAESEARAAAEREKKQKAQNDFRQREIDRARGLWIAATDCRISTDVGVEGAVLISAYLKARTRFDPAGTIFDHIRYNRRATYWHGVDEAERPLSLYVGPALVAPIVDVSTRAIIGSQTIWIDLSVKPKRRPVLWGLTGEGRKAGFSELDFGGAKLPPRDEWVAAGYYAKISSKKMRGAKEGGLIPAAGRPEVARWVCGEGIETVLSFAGREGFRDDTFYFAAGDIGNMAGPADPASGFNHPTAKMTDARGRERAVRVQGPVPKTSSEGKAFPVLSHVTDLVILVDGDSEPVATCSAMARLEARVKREGLSLDFQYPKVRADWADMISADAPGTDND